MKAALNILCISITVCTQTAEKITVIELNLNVYCK